MRPEIQKLCQYIEKLELEIGVVLLVPAVKPVIVALPLLIEKSNSPPSSLAAKTRPENSRPVINNVKVNANKLEWPLRLAGILNGNMLLSLYQQPDRQSAPTYGLFAYESVERVIYLKFLIGQHPINNL